MQFSNIEVIWMLHCSAPQDLHHLWPWQRKCLLNVWHQWSSCCFCHLWGTAVEEGVSLNSKL